LKTKFVHLIVRSCNKFGVRQRLAYDQTTTNNNSSFFSKKKHMMKNTIYCDIGYL